MKETSQPTESQAKKGLGPTRNTHIVPSISIHLADAFYLTTLMVACDIHYRRHGLCRVPNALPSVLYRALGKGVVCRVSPSVKGCTRQIDGLPSARH